MDWERAKWVRDTAAECLSAAVQAIYLDETCGCDASSRSRAVTIRHSKSHVIPVVGSLILLLCLTPAQAASRLEIRQAGPTNLLLTWTDPTTAVLEGEELHDTGWRAPLSVPVFNGATYSLSVPLATSRRFFRLGQNHLSIYSLPYAVDRIDTSYGAFRYDPGQTVVQDMDGDHHIQGVGYYQGHYYLTRSRPAEANTEKLLVISESTARVVSCLDLDPQSTHPGGFQIHNGVLAVPFEIASGNARISFYGLSNPIAPTLLGSFTSSVQNGYCVGLTDYQGMYLVAHYYSRPGLIRFYLVDRTFRKVAERRWEAAAQDRSQWVPLNIWPSDAYNYETMSLLKVQAPGQTTPVYFMILYHSSNAADFFSISDPNLSVPLDIRMIARLQFSPYGPGFRYGAGMAILDQNSLVFFSSLKHVHATADLNVISIFKPQ